jgi:hypothetical protein
MNRETGAAGFDGLVELPRAAELLGELGKSDRRRIALNPASKILDPLIVRHYGYGTVTLCVLRPVRPRLSVTVNVTLNEPAAGYVWLTTCPEPLAPSPNDHA